MSNIAPFTLERSISSSSTVARITAGRPRKPSVQNSASTSTVGEGRNGIASPPTGQYATDVCYNTVNRKIYSADYYSSQLSVFDAQTNEVIRTVSLGGQPVREQQVVHGFERRHRVFDPWRVVSVEVSCRGRDPGLVVRDDGVDAVRETLGNDAGVVCEGIRSSPFRPAAPVL